MTATVEQTIEVEAERIAAELSRLAGVDAPNEPG